MDYFYQIMIQMETLKKLLVYQPYALKLKIGDILFLNLYLYQVKMNLLCVILIIIIIILIVVNIILSKIRLLNIQ